MPFTMAGGLGHCTAEEEVYEQHILLVGTEVNKRNTIHDKCRKNRTQHCRAIGMRIVNISYKEVNERITIIV